MRWTAIALALLACSGRSSTAEPARASEEVVRAPDPLPPDRPAPAPLRLPPTQRTCAVPPALGDVAIERGLVFTRVGGEALRLDLARPRGPGPHPWVVLLHGGGWRAGERGHMDEELTTLVGLGYAAASVDYRLLDDVRGNRFPAQIADVRCAVRYLRREADRLGLDPERAGVLGYSAGGHLALLLGTGADEDALDQSCVDRVTSPAVQAVVAFYAPTDLRPDVGFSRPTEGVLRRFLGGPRDAQAELATLASPAALVDAADAPTLLVHGTDDPVVPVEQARRMRAALSGAGVPVRYVEVDGGRHGFRVFPRRGARDLTPTCTTVAFLEATLGPVRSRPGA